MSRGPWQWRKSEVHWVHPYTRSDEWVQSICPKIFENSRRSIVLFGHIRISACGKVLLLQCVVNWTIRIMHPTWWSSELFNFFWILFLCPCGHCSSVIFFGLSKIAKLKLIPECYSDGADETLSMTDQIFLREWFRIPPRSWFRNLWKQGTYLSLCGLLTNKSLHPV